MQMKMDQKFKKFDRNKCKKLLEEENAYIIDILTTFDVPDSVENEELESMYLLDNKKPSTSSPSVADLKKTSRAQDADELEERLQIIKNKLNSKKSKMSERTIKKREMKKLKKEKEFKKKLSSVHKSLKNEKIKEEKVAGEDTKVKEDTKPASTKPIFNEEGKIVFSKFDFASHPGAKAKKSRKEKVVKNPKVILKQMKDQKKKIAELQEQGDEEKLKEVKQEMAWKKVFDKTEGKKVKDDPTLLYKAIKRKKDQKKKSKQKWIERKDKVEQDIAGRQKKRQENINKKIKEKKMKKLKRLSKKGRVIPGF